MATPETTRLPSSFISISNQDAQAQGSTQVYRHIFIGTKLAAGNAEYDSTYLVSDLASAASLFGIGSSSYAYAQNYLAQNSGIPLYMVAVNDTSNTAASVEVEFAGTPEEAPLHFYVGDKKTTVMLPSSPGLDGIAGRLIPAINLNAEIEVTAAAVGGNDNAMSLTCKTKGTHGNEIKVYKNAGGETDNSAVTISANQLTGGANVASNLQNTLDAISDEVQYLTWSTCFTDNDSVALIKADLESRFASDQTTEAQLISGIQGTAAEINAKGNVPNSQLVTYIPMDPLMISLPWVFGAEVNAEVAKSASQDQALPFTGIKINNVVYRQDGVGSRLSRNARNQFLYNGVSSYNIVAGEYVIARLITTYRVNAQNSPDVSYLDLNTFFVNAFIRYDLRSVFSSYYNQKLANDGTRVVSQTNFVTPSLARAAVVGRANVWSERGLIEDLDKFVETLEVNRHSTDPGRLDIVTRPDQVNQFRLLNLENRFIR